MRKKMARRRRKKLGVLAVLQGENVKKRVQNNVTMYHQIPRKIQNNVTIEKNWPDFNLNGGGVNIMSAVTGEKLGEWMS